jgi:Rieske Fe-S protein
MALQDQEHPPSPFGKSRRSFLGALLGLAAVSVGALLSVPVLRYILYPVTAKAEDSEWTSVGPVAGLSHVTTPVQRILALKQRDGWRETASQPVVYLIKSGGTIKALSAVCPHLGCTVPWDAGRNEFVCPCHGGVFGPDGTHLSGPPPRSMDALETKVSGGTLMVRYQYFRPDVPSKQVTG